MGRPAAREQGQVRRPQIALHVCVLRHPRLTIGPTSPARRVALALLALLLAAAALAHTACEMSGLARSDAWMWMAMLLALPYAAALLCAALAAWPERVMPWPERPRAKPAAQAVAGSATRTAAVLTAIAPRSGRQTSGLG